MSRNRHPMTVYFDSHLTDAERRQRIYEGHLFVYSPRPSTLALTGFARELIEGAFAPLEPERAQSSLSVQQFIDIVGPLKPRFIHHRRTLELLLALLDDLGVPREQTYFDVPRMRVATSGGYLNAGVAYVLHPHRDIWDGSPPCQLNWWLPVYPFESESSFAFHSRYWTEPVPNTSHEYNHYEWNKVGRAQADKQITSDTRNQPKATVPLELEPDVRVVCPPGGIILFSGAHLTRRCPTRRVDRGSASISEPLITMNWRTVAARRPSTGTAPEPPCSSCAGRAISPPYPTRSCGLTIATRRPPATAWCLGLQPGLPSWDVSSCLTIRATLTIARIFPRPSAPGI